MEVEKIPADELVTMTDIFHRAFNGAGCDPACHGCWGQLPVGARFKLATVDVAVSKGSGTDKMFTESKEVMLCEWCTPEIAQQSESAARKRAKDKHDTLGCYRINGKIIH